MRSTSPLTEFAGSHTPIHADPAREYHWVARWDTYERDDNAITFVARDEEGAALTVRLTFVDAAVLRIQLLTPGATEPATTPMLVPAEPRRVTLSLEETDVGLRLRTPVLLVEVNRAPWRLRVASAGRPLFRQEHADKGFDKYVAFPFGYSVGPDGDVAAHETWALEADEHLYGLGGGYGAFDKRGGRHTGWLREAYGTNTTDVSYTAVPLLLSSRGYGLFVNQTERTTWEIGHPSTVSASVRSDSATLDYFLIGGPDPKTVLSRYAALTGRPALPPLWSFGVWMSRCMYQNRAEATEAIDRMRGLGLPVDVVHIDPRWLQAGRAHEADGCDFVWDTDAWGEPGGFVAAMRERGVHVSLWENPYVWRDVPLYAEGAERGYFALGPGGTPIAPTDNPDAALVDFTNPAAMAWWQDLHRPLLEAGVAAFKTDYGEAVPAEARFHNGQTGAQVHNVYPLLYTGAAFNVTEQVHGAGNALVFARAGTAGSQRYPTAWSGDPQATWTGMAGALRSGLSQAMSGTPFWTADIGGFYGGEPGAWEQPDPDLYTRWAAWGLLLSHARFHGVGPREPWAFGEEAVRVVREFSELRYRLLPYLWGLAHEAAETCVPVIRPLALEFPRDPAAPRVDTQFMLGPSLLVCPVLNAEGRVRVWLPEGRWWDWWDGTVHEGARFRDLTIPLDRIPLFVRDGSVLPLAPPVGHTGERPWQPLELQVRGEATADLVLWTPDGRRVPVRANRRNTRLQVRIENVAHQWTVRMVGVVARDAGLTGAAVELEWSVEGSDTVARFRMTGQGSAQFTATV